MIWQFGDFVLDSVRLRLLDSDGSVIPIHPKAFKVLECLVRNAPNIASREELLMEVWGHSELSPTALSQAIYELRRALNDDANQPRVIGTRHGQGYCLLVESRPVTGRQRLWFWGRGSLIRQLFMYVLIAVACFVAGVLVGACQQPEPADRGDNEISERLRLLQIGGRFAEIPSPVRREGQDGVDFKVLVDIMD